MIGRRALSGVLAGVLLALAGCIERVGGDPEPAATSTAPPPTPAELLEDSAAAMAVRARLRTSPSTVDGRAAGA